jgi:DNA polymerase sliding clamp subunit B
MFRLIYGSSKDFYYIISSMSKITEKIILNFTDEGINSKHLTEDKVMMGVISVPRDALDEYSLDKPLSIELDLGEIKKIFAKG